MILLILSSLTLIAWLKLLCAHGNYWQGSERLGPSPAPKHWPKVAIVIPARNEEATIRPVLLSHLASAYPGETDLIVVDDHSSDHTRSMAEAIAEATPRAMTIASAPDLESGWSGKLAAVNHGLDVAREKASDAKYVLLTDADITHGPKTLAALVAKAETDDLALVSLMARLDERGVWGGLLIPAFVYFFQKLYPFPRVNNHQDPMAAAAGGCMLVRRDALEAAGGIAAIKNNLIDDCALAKLIKGAPPTGKVWLCLAENEVVSLRDNRALGSIWHMVARTAYTQLNHSPLLLAGTIIGMMLVYLTPPAIVLGFFWHGQTLPAVLAGVAWMIMAATYFPTARLYEQARWKTAFLPVAGALYTAMTFSSAVNHWRGRGGQWKGRVY